MSRNNSGDLAYEANYCAGLRILDIKELEHGADSVREVAYFDVAPDWNTVCCLFANIDRRICSHVARLYVQHSTLMLPYLYTPPVIRGTSLLELVLTVMLDDNARLTCDTSTSEWW